MGSDAQWQDENGFSREVRGDFSASEYNSADDTRPPCRDYFYSFEAAAMLAKAFPGSALQLSDVKRTRRGEAVRMYEVNTFAARNHPDAQQRERYQREYYVVLKAAKQKDISQ